MSSVSKKEEVMNQVKSELALANAQELITKMNEKCFKACVPTPGTKLDNGEQACITKCIDRYMEAWNIVSKTYVKRVQQENKSSSFA